MKEQGLKQVLDKVLEKGVVIDTNLGASLVDFELLDLSAHVVLGSLKTASKIGLAFPEGTNLEARGWRELAAKQLCPICGMGLRVEDLEEGCPWCGWNLRLR